MKALKLFLDTNTLLHYPPIADVDWLSICNARQVTIIICLQVIQELDAHKSGGRLASRAARAIKELRSVHAGGGHVRKGVILYIYNEELRSAEFPESLSFESGDDRIVHSVKKYIEAHNKPNVAVYTEDFGMQLRCEAHGIPTLVPPAHLRLDSPKTEEERKHAAVVSELNRLKNRQPKISVTVYRGKDAEDRPMSIELMKPATPSLEEVIAQERERIIIPEGSVRLVGVSSLVQINENDRRRFNEECEEYLEEYGKWWERCLLVDDVEAREFSFNVLIENSGSSAADDLDVYLDFPPILRFLEGDDNTPVGKRPRRPARPDPPKKPRPRGLDHLHGLSSLRDAMGNIYPEYNMPRIPIVNPPGTPWSSFSGDVDEGLQLRIYFPKLNHHKQREFGPFFTAMRSWDACKPFEIAVSVMASNLVDRIESRVPVLVSAQDPV